MSNGYLIHYVSQNGGVCLDMQYGKDCFEAVGNFLRTYSLTNRKSKDICSIRKIG